MEEKEGGIFRVQRTTKKYEARGLIFQIESEEGEGDSKPRLQIERGKKILERIRLIGRNEIISVRIWAR